MLFSYCFIEIMLQDKIALVTGGATGIGKAIGLQLAKNRAKVAIASRNHSRLERAAAEAGHRVVTHEQSPAARPAALGASKSPFTGNGTIFG